MRSETIEQLKRISQPKQFYKDDYICHEGQPGNEMYIILKGLVGIFVINAIGTLDQVATIEEGDFFGEMAIFDNLPRSASCIALENTLTVAITQENLDEFLATCPDMAGKILKRMSGRIRKLDDELYKNNRFVKNRHVPRFEIPFEFKEGHSVREQRPDEKVLIQHKQACPICGKAISVTGIKKNKLQERGFGVDCRMTYMECNPLWYEVISCPRCYYSNHYLHFFGINNFEYELVKELLIKEHKPVVESRIAKRGEFDYLVLRYLQAIHINEHIDAGNSVLIGGLWRNLYWLSKDADDWAFADYCVKKAIEKYKEAFDKNQITEEEDCCSTAMSLVCMMTYCKDDEDILKYVDIATKASDKRIYNNAIRMKAKLEQ